MNHPLSYVQRMQLEGYNPVVLLRGVKNDRTPFFAYVEMSIEDYYALTPENFSDVYACGNVILEGEGIPNAAQIAFMENHYEFDHSPISWEDCASN